MENKGDGVMQRLIDSGLCPRCEAKSKGRKCFVCGLEVIEQEDLPVRARNTRLTEWLAKRPDDGLAG